MGRRARASWPVWLIAAAVGSGAITWVRARTPPDYTVTAVLRVTQGPVHSPDDLSSGALRSHVKVATFTRARLAEIMTRHPREFRTAVNRDPVRAYEAMRERITIDISQDDVLGPQDESDPPRSARISLSFIASTPRDAWDVTHELADLLINSTLARQRAAALRERAAAAQFVERAAEHADDTAVMGSPKVRYRLQAADKSAAGADLAVRATEQGQALRFELVDPGQMPAVTGTLALVIAFIVWFVVLLAGGALFAGAFDSRVLGGPDIRALGIPLLGELPPLRPPPRTAAPTTPPAEPTRSTQPVR